MSLLEQHAREKEGPSHVTAAHLARQMNHVPKVVSGAIS